MPERADDLQTPTPVTLPMPRLKPASWRDGGDFWEANTHDAHLTAIPAGAQKATESLLRFPKTAYPTETQARAALGRLYPSLGDSAANADGTYNLYNRMLFSEGVWNGDPYSADDLREMVRAHDEIGAELRPWAALGHDPAQTYAKSHGLPRVGSLSGLRVGPHEKDPTKLALYGDILNVPEPVYRSVEQKGYPTRSPEIYHELKWNGKIYPRVMRAIALLGTEEAGNPTLPDLFRSYERADSLDGELHVYAFEADGEEVHDSLAPVAPSAPDDALRLSRVQRAYQARDGKLVPGLPLRITYPAGVIRTGQDSAGRPWQRLMTADYAAIPGTLGADGDALDAYVNPEFSGEDSGADTVFIVRQVDPQTGAFDEDKAMLGFPDLLSARDAYLAHMPDPGFLGGVRSVPLADYIQGIGKVSRSSPGKDDVPMSPHEAPDLTAAAQERSAEMRAKAQAALAVVRRFSFNPNQARDKDGKWASEGDQAAHHALQALSTEGPQALGHKITAHLALAKFHLKSGNDDKAKVALKQALAGQQEMVGQASVMDGAGKHKEAHALLHYAEHYRTAAAGLLGLNGSGDTVSHHSAAASIPKYHTPSTVTPEQVAAAKMTLKDAEIGPARDILDWHKQGLEANQSGKKGAAVFYEDQVKKGLKAADPAKLSETEKTQLHKLAASLGLAAEKFAKPEPEPAGKVKKAVANPDLPPVAVAPHLHIKGMTDHWKNFTDVRRARAAYHGHAIKQALETGDTASYEHHHKMLRNVIGQIASERDNAKKAGDMGKYTPLVTHVAHTRALLKGIEKDKAEGGKLSDTSLKLLHELGSVGTPLKPTPAGLIDPKPGHEVATPAPAPHPAPPTKAQAQAALETLKASIAKAPKPKKAATPKQPVEKPVEKQLWTPDATPAVTPITGLSVQPHHDLTGTLVKTGLGGSNGAAMHEGKDGKQYVIKKYGSPEQAYNEHVSNTIYGSLGIPVAQTHMTSDGAHASEVLAGSTEVKGMQDITQKQARDFLGGFMADVALSNWDAIGTGGGSGENKGGDNLRVKDGKLYRIDNGGSLLFRAQAGKKKTGFHETLSELENFMSMNPQYANMMHRAGVGHWSEIPGIEDQARRVVQALSPAHIDALTKAAPGVTEAQRKELRGVLIKRRELVEQVPTYIAKHKAVKALAMAQAASINGLAAKKPQEVAGLAAAGKLPHHAKATAYAAALDGVQAVKKIASAPDATVKALLETVKARSGAAPASIHNPTQGALAEQHFQKLKDHVTACHATAEHKAVKIITEGGFKTIMEPGTVGGGGDGYQSGSRKNVETKAFKIWKGDADGKNAPLYTAVAPSLDHAPPPPFRQNSLHYGKGSPVIFDLHPHVLERSTFYQNDSCDHYHATHDCTKKLMSKDEATATYAAREAGGNHSFIECHPTGGVTMEDVRALRVTEKGRADRMRKVLDNAGYTNLPIYIESGGTLTHHSGIDARKGA